MIENDFVSRRFTFRLGCSATAKTEFKAVAYASRSLSETERRLCSNREGSVGHHLGSRKVF